MTVHTLGQLIDCPVLASDGARGTVVDAYFDESDWSIRFLLVRRTDAGMLSTVLVPADAVMEIDMDMDTIRVCQLPRRDAVITLAAETPANARLRSSLQVLNCTISGWDDSLGHAVDAVFETTDWILRFLLIDAGSWCSGARFLVEPDLVHEMRWEDHIIAVAVTRDEILSAPNTSVDACDEALPDQGDMRRVH